MTSYDFSYTFQDVVKVVERYFKDEQGRTPSKLTKEEIEDYNNSVILRLYLTCRNSDKFTTESLIGFYVLVFSKFSKAEIKKAIKYLRKNNKSKIKLPSNRYKIVLIILGIVLLLLSYDFYYGAYNTWLDMCSLIFPIISIICISIAIFKTNKLMKFRKHAKKAQKIPIVNTNCPTCGSSNKQYVKELGIDWLWVCIFLTIISYGILLPCLIAYIITSKYEPRVNQYLCLNCNTTFDIKDYSKNPKYRYLKSLILCENSFLNTINNTKSKEKEIENKQKIEKKKEVISNTKYEDTDKHLKNIATIREYKKLLDEGILTKEEFEKKKKQLLNS